MQVSLSPGARKHLRKLKCGAIAVRLVDMETSDSVGFAREVQVECGFPQRREQYHRLEVDGVEVFVDPRLRVEDTVRIKKQGFWKLSGLYADGVRIPL